MKQQLLEEKIQYKLLTFFETFQSINHLMKVSKESHGHRYMLIFVRFENLSFKFTLTIKKIDKEEYVYHLDLSSLTLIDVQKKSKHYSVPIQSFVKTMGDYSDLLVKELCKEVMEYILSNYEQLCLKIEEEVVIEQNKEEKRALLSKANASVALLTREQLIELNDFLKERFNCQ